MGSEMAKSKALIVGALLLTGAAAAILGLRAGRNAERTSVPENVLLITIDTLRADHLGCFGYAGASTPSIDRLASAGVRFERTHAHNVITLPSHSNILTGLYPITHGVRDNSGFRLPTSLPTLATLLKARGFACGAFVGAFPVDSRFGLDRGFDVYDDNYGDATGAADFRFVERRAEEVVTPFLAWLDGLPPTAAGLAAAGGRPGWFAWVHFYDPHSPYDPPEPFKTKFAGRPYDGEISYADSQVGRIVDHLREGGRLRSTCIIVTADHGEGLGDHGEGTHGLFAYESTLHVPLIIDGPGFSSRVVHSPVRHIDVVPTILDLLRAPIPGSLNGRSLLPLLKGTGDSPPADSYFEAMTASLNRGWAPLRGIISGPYKYIDLPIAELYEIDTDRGERTNLVNVRPEIVRSLRAQLAGLDRTGGRVDRVAEDPETLEKLKSLGYVSTEGPVQTKSASLEEDDPKRLIELDNLLNDAIVAAGSGDLQRARDELESIIEKRPTMSVAYSHLAYVYREMGLPEKALQTIRRALERGIDSPELRIRLGLFLDEAGKSKEAVAILEKAVTETADNTDGLTYLGMACAHAGDPARAIQTFRKIVDANPGNAGAYANMGAVFLQERNYQEAIDALEKALRIDPGFAAAHNSLGVALASTGNAEAAAAHWEQAINRDPRQYDTIYNLAILYANLGRAEEAKRCMELFVRTAPPARYAADIQEFKKALEE